MKRFSLIMMLLLLVPLFACAAIDIPKASGKALGVTKGKPFSSGLVFINGRYIEPPYVVERWGVGIRINGIPAVAQVIDWTDFIKTQAGVKVTKTEAPVPAAGDEESMGDEEEEEEPADIDDFIDFDDALDDLFEDDSSEKKETKKPAKKPAKKARPAKPRATVTYSLEGDFVPNEASRALVQKVNKSRAEIDAMLREGRFIFFGDRYARVSGDARTAAEILEKLPEIEKKSKSAAELVASVRASYLVFLTEPICRDLFQNRRDYLKLQRRRDKERTAREDERLMRGGL